LIRIILISFSLIFSQSLDVTFKYVESPNDDFVRVFVPGTMPEGSSNDWGPNSNGFINPDAPSQMLYNETSDSYEKTYNLQIGNQYLYKLHFHHNNSGTNYSWVSDPFNSEITNDNWANSILNVTDPLIFQIARHFNIDSQVKGFSAGIFTSGNIDYIRYSVGDDTLSATDNLQENGILYLSFEEPLSIYGPLFVEVSIDNQIYEIYNVEEIEVIEEPIPEEVEMGPNYINGSMYLALYAPSQPLMRVAIVEHGDSEDDAQIFTLNRDPNMDDIWWIELNLPSGQYEYEYLLFNGNRIADPLSRRLNDGKTLIEIGPGGISTADDYNWQSSNYIRPHLDTLIIYELHIDDFSSEGNGQGKFENIIEKLDHLKSTGINAIELLPISDFPGVHSWGYDPHLNSAIESNYGTPEDFKLLVDEAHLRGIAVILDIVWNHIRSSSPIWQIQPDYVLNPYIKIHNELNPNETEGSWGMLDWDHFNSKTIEYINKVNKIWLEEYRIDGFRFDATRMIGWDMDQLHFGLPSWTSAISSIDSTIYQIAEHLPSDPWLIDNTDFTSGWHDSFHDVIKSDVHGNYNSTMDLMRQVVQLHEYSNWGDPYSNRNQAVKYMISHDEQSVIQEMVIFNNFTIEEARERDKFYANILFTSLGIPMLFQGQEFGFMSGWDDENNNGDYDEEKLQYRPIDWSLLDSEVGQSHLDHYSKLILFRKSNPALYRGQFHDLYRYSNEKVIVYGYEDVFEQNNNNDQVVVIANFSTMDQIISNIPFLSNGRWYDIFGSYTLDVNENSTYDEFDIPKKTAIIFSNRQWNLNVENRKNVPEDYSYFSCYPNPFNDHLTIKFFTFEDKEIKINIFDLNGKIVYTDELKNISSGENFIKWNGMTNDGLKLSSAVYIVSIANRTKVYNQKILFLK